MIEPNSRKVILYLAQSLDGFIAEKDGSTAWLAALDSSESDAAIQAFQRTVDTVVMGRKTYEQSLKLAGTYPYQDKNGYVFSKTLHDTEDRTHVVAGNIPEFMRQLKKEDGGNIWLVGGAEIFTELLKAQLVDELIITIAPVLLGDGISLVSTHLTDMPLELINSRQIGHFVELTYKINY
ncbi:dihydrofolate reductase [Latilactobacillus curvatus]|uniref:dihydrofolate reductase family protein n=1 Tax=Latilactobacillus curvatus TaxID=28038 RepID=UPI0011BB60B2|nr:dihydrofolate reductase family protein [Latilactobacillus curvatus]QEA48720.1 dihydrofolate reductase [Latilactobacillus curvatus]